MKNIYERINEIRKQVDYIQKDIDKKKLGYAAVSHDMVTASLRSALIEHGVIILPTLMDSDVKDTGTTTSSGIPIIRYEATINVRFVNMDAPEDFFEIDIPAHANDHGDKAPGKALSYAVKYAMLKVFSLETGENEESRVEGELAKITEAQLKSLTDVCDQYDWPVKETLETLAATYNVDGIEQLPEAWFDDAVKRMHARAQKLAKAKGNE